MSRFASRNRQSGILNPSFLFPKLTSILSIPSYSSHSPSSLPRPLSSLPQIVSLPSIPPTHPLPLLVSFLSPHLILPSPSPFIPSSLPLLSPLPSFPLKTPPSTPFSSAKTQFHSYTYITHMPVVTLTHTHACARVGVFRTCTTAFVM